MNLREVFAYCPKCGSENEPMGVLGTTIHFNCRDCGWHYFDRDHIDREALDVREEC